MSFISFSLNYYKNKIEHYENDDLSENEIYEAKQLLKILDDLLDEGYTYLNQKLEEDFKGVTRLKKLFHHIMKSHLLFYQGRTLKLTMAILCMI